MVSWSITSLSLSSFRWGDNLYWYRLQMPRDEVYVKCPTVFVDRKAARRVAAREAGQVMVLECDGPSGQGVAG